MAAPAQQAAPLSQQQQQQQQQQHQHQPAPRPQLLWPLAPQPDIVRAAQKVGGLSRLHCLLGSKRARAVEKRAWFWRVAAHNAGPS